MDNVNESNGAVDLAAIGERYEERGFFARTWAMLKGLRRPHGTREYREARIELQRLAAPLAALVSVSLFVVALCVMTAVQSQARKEIEVNILPIEEEFTLDEPEPEPEPVDMTADVSEEAVEFELPGVAAPAVPVPAPQQTSAPSAIAPVDSPVYMNINAPVGLRGLGLGDGGGFGTQVGGGGGQDLRGCLIGTIIDFKRKADGSTRIEYGQNSSYWKDLKKLLEGNFSPESMSDFFVTGKRVALTHLWIPPQSAANGPKAFGVEKVMKPSGFAVYYKGQLKANERKTYRFWGYFDDWMLVRMDGKVVLEYEWNTRASKNSPVAGWMPSDKAAVGRVKCPQNGGVLTPGDWFTLDAGRAVNMELVVGERPGGLLGGILLIEEQGVKYPKDKNGSTILPIFASRPLAQTTKLDLSEAEYKMGVDSPRFNAAPVSEENEAPEGDVGVDVII